MADGLRTIVLGRDPERPSQQPVPYRVETVRTLAQDVWIMQTVRRAGLDNVDVPESAAKDQESFDGYLTKLVERIFAADLVGDLLAGVLVKESSPTWTTAEAKQTKAMVLGLRDPDEKKLLLDLLSEILHSFLSGGRSS